MLGAKVRVTTKHLPILVAGDQRRLFDPEARFEQAAGPFVPEVVEVQVFDTEVDARSVEGSADGTVLIGKDAEGVTIWRLALFHQKVPGVVAAHTKEGDMLVIAGLVPRVLSVADEERAQPGIYAGPFDGADFLQAHARPDSVLDDPLHRKAGLTLCPKMSEQGFELVVSGAPVTFIALADQAKAL